MDIPVTPLRPGSPEPRAVYVDASRPLDQLDDQPRGIELRAFLVMLRRNSLLIGGLVLLALLVGLIVTLLTTRKYVATASIQIEQRTEKVLNTEDVDPSGFADAERFLQTQTDILRSRAMAIAVVQSLKLANNRRFLTAMGIEPPSAAQGRTTEQASRELTIGLVRDNISVNLPRNSRIVGLSFRSADPELSAEVANAYARAFIAANLQRKYNSSAYAREFLSAQLVEAKARLEESERTLNSYARAAGLIGSRSSAGPGTEPTTSARSVTTASLIQLNEAFNRSKSTRIAAEQRWRTAEAMPAMSLPEVLSNTAITQLVERRAEKQSQLSLERIRHGEDYPTVRESRAEIEELNRQIRTIAENVRNSIRDQYQGAFKEEQALGSQVGALKEATLSEQDRSVQFNILSREVDTNRALYDGLLQRYKEVSAAAGVASNNISVVDEADVPLNPSSPRLFVNLAFALLGGLGLAALAVFAREQIDDAVRMPADVERKLGLPLLGTVPKVPAAENVQDTLAEIRSPLAESYFALRSTLLYATAEGLPHSLLITSSQAGEGKSTSSYAIADNMAKLGKRVILIDADLRRPSLHRRVDISNLVGLSDVLVHQAPLDQAVVRYDPGNIWLMTSGPLPPSPTDILGNGRLREVLAELEKQFDLIVIDGPPVLGLADAPMLAAQADATLLIIEANRGYRGRTKGAIRRLRSAHSRIIGAVLTKFEARKAGVGYEYGYDYYSYGSRAK